MEANLMDEKKKKKQLILLFVALVAVVIVIVTTKHPTPTNIPADPAFYTGPRPMKSNPSIWVDAYGHRSSPPPGYRPPAIKLHARSADL